MNKINRMAHGEKPGPVIKKGSTIISNQGGLSGAEKPFDAMNSIVANLLLNITRYKNTLLCCFVILVKFYTSILVCKYSLQHNLCTGWPHVTQHNLVSQSFSLQIF